MPQGLRLLRANTDSFIVISGSSFLRNAVRRSHRPRSHLPCRAEMHSIRNAFPSCHRECSASHQRVLFCLRCSDMVSSPIGIVPKPIVSKLSQRPCWLSFCPQRYLSSENQDSLPPPTSPFLPTTSHGPSADRLIGKAVFHFNSKDIAQGLIPPPFHFVHKPSHRAIGNSLLASARLP